jgi:hypothetical protein
MIKAGKLEENVLTLRQREAEWIKANESKVLHDDGLTVKQVIRSTYSCTPEDYCTMLLNPTEEVHEGGRLGYRWGDEFDAVCLGQCIRENVMLLTRKLNEEGGFEIHAVYELEHGAERKRPPLLLVWGAEGVGNHFDPAVELTQEGCEKDIEFANKLAATSELTPVSNTVRVTVPGSDTHAYGEGKMIVAEERIPGLQTYTEVLKTKHKSKNSDSSTSNSTSAAQTSSHESATARRQEDLPGDFFFPRNKRTHQHEGTI